MFALDVIALDVDVDVSRKYVQVVPILAYNLAEPPPPWGEKKNRKRYRYVGVVCDATNAGGGRWSKGE